MTKRYSITIDWTDPTGVVGETHQADASSFAAAIRDEVRRSTFRRGGKVDESVRITVRRVV